MSASTTDGEPPAARCPDDKAIGDGGFTLVEVLVALAIFALAFAGLYRAFDGGWRSLRRAQLEAETIEVAKSQLAAVGIVTPLADGRQSGETSDGVRWQIEVRRRGDRRLPPGSPGPRAAAFDVSVSAGRASRTGEQAMAVVLKTVRLGERPQ